jgi:acetylornithine/succinyldiaminopimelate/putrescine aminotransferase
MTLAPTYARYDVTFVSGSGCVLVDADGVEYLDFLSGIAVNNLGHCHPAVVAAVLIEPIQGESGVLEIPAEVLADIRAACDDAGAALIFDEVQTGIGRTGTLFAYEQLGVVPDAMTLAKGLGGGLPVGALVIGPDLAGVFAPGDHGSTFAGGPVVSAAAHAVLDVIDDEAFLAAVRERGEQLRDGLRSLPGVSEVRGRGLIVAGQVAGYAPDIARRALLDQRLIINATGPATLRFLPPLIVDAAQIDDALSRLRALLG